MTVTLYARSDIKEMLIEDGVRTWSAVTSVPWKNDLFGSVTIYNMTTSIQVGTLCATVFGFTFETEAAAMAFRLRHGDYLVERPSHPDCDDLMALEPA